MKKGARESGKEQTELEIVVGLICTYVSSSLYTESIIILQLYIYGYLHILNYL